MKSLHSYLNKIDEYLVSIKNDPNLGIFIFEIGIPNTWVYNETDNIACDLINEGNGGKLLKVYPKNEDTTVDDSYSFIELIIETNKKIAEREIEFTKKMDSIKASLEQEAKAFYDELDVLKQNSFKTLNSTKPKAEETTKKKKDKETIVESENSLANE